MLARFRKMLEALRETARSETASDVLKQMLVETGYLQALRDDASTESRDRLENLNALVSAAVTGKIDVREEAA